MGLWLLQESLRTWELGACPSSSRRCSSPRASSRRADRRSIPTTRCSWPRATCRPGSRPPARIRGDRPPASRPELVRCILDSLAAAYGRTIRDAARLSGRSIEVVHLVGGGARNALLCQLTADACELPVIAGPVEATALGNVLVQARAHGLLSGRPREPARARPDDAGPPALRAPRVLGRIGILTRCGSPCSSPASTTRCSRRSGVRSPGCCSVSATRSRFPRSRPAAGRCTSTRATATPASRWSSGSRPPSPGSMPW